MKSQKQSYKAEDPACNWVTGKTDLSDPLSRPGQSHPTRPGRVSFLTSAGSDMVMAVVVRESSVECGAGAAGD